MLQHAANNCGEQYADSLKRGICAGEEEGTIKWSHKIKSTHVFCMERVVTLLIIYIIFFSKVTQK